MKFYVNLVSRVGSLKIKIRQIPKLGVLADFRNPGLVFYNGNFYPRFLKIIIDIHVNVLYVL